MTLVDNCSLKIFYIPTQGAENCTKSLTQQSVYLQTSSRGKKEMNSSHLWNQNLNLKYMHCDKTYNGLENMNKYIKMYLKCIILSDFEFQVKHVLFTFIQ